MMLSLGQGGEIGWKLWSFRMLRVMFLFVFFGGGMLLFDPLKRKVKNMQCVMRVCFSVLTVKILRKFPLDCVSASI